MRPLPVVSALAALLAVTPALATTVAVAPIRDDQQAEGEALRKQLEHGLADNGITVVSFAALMQAAGDQGVAAADLAKPAVLMPVAKAAGAEAVLTGAVLRDGHTESLDIRVFNLDGVELWSRPIPLKKGKLGADLPRKIAHAVAAAVASGPAAVVTAPEPTPKPDEGVTTPEPTPTPKPDEGVTTPPTPKPDEGTTQDNQTEETPPPHRPIAASSDDTSGPSKPVKKGKKAKSTGDEDVEVEGPPVEAKPDTTPAPPYIDVGVGATITFRTYDVCPGVTSCSQTGPTPSGNKDIPIKYSTSAPYGGFDVNLEAFPLPRLVSINDSLTFTGGVIGEFGQSLSLSNNYQDPTTGAQKTFSSSEQHAEVGAAARLYYSALGGNGFVGIDGAFELHKFSVDPNPVLTESARVGFGIGLGGELPLVSDYFRVLARFTYMPAMNPGVPETTAYGQSGTGSGYDFRAGFDGSFGYIGYSATFAYTAFADVFTGPGEVTTNGAVTVENYTSIYIMIHGHF